MGVNRKWAQPQRALLCSRDGMGATTNLELSRVSSEKLGVNSRATEGGRQDANQDRLPAPFRPDAP